MLINRMRGQKKKLVNLKKQQQNLPNLNKQKENRLKKIKSLRGPWNKSRRSKNHVNGDVNFPEKVKDRGDWKNIWKKKIAKK